MTADTLRGAPFVQAFPQTEAIHRRGRRLLVFVPQQQ